jgi:hypothetical protein
LEVAFPELHMQKLSPSHPQTVGRTVNKVGNDGARWVPRKKR